MMINNLHVDVNLLSNHDFYVHIINNNITKNCYRENWAAIYSPLPSRL